MRRGIVVVVLLGVAVFSFKVGGQSGRTTESGDRRYTINVLLQPATETVTAADGGSGDSPTFSREQIALYEGGVEQAVENVRADQSAARIVLLVDNSKDVRTDANQMEKTARALVKELYSGDQVMMASFSDSAEIIEDFTEDAEKLLAAAKLFGKKSTPRLYDALTAVVEDALRKEISTPKRVVILLSDGYDNGSQTEYEHILRTLQRENIVVYAIQTADRTFGAPRNKKLGPKPVDALRGLVEGTGGRSFRIEDSPNAMKIITEEIRNRWFSMTYTPRGTNRTIARRLLVSLAHDKYTMRSKKEQPAEEY